MNQGRGNESDLKTEFKRHLSKYNETTTEKERALFETSLQNSLDNRKISDSVPVPTGNPLLLSDTTLEKIKPSESVESGKVYSEYLDVNLKKPKEASKGTKKGSDSAVTSVQNASNQSISFKETNASDKPASLKYLDKDRLTPTTKQHTPSHTEQKQPSGHSELGEEQDKELIQQIPRAAKLEIEMKTRSFSTSEPDKSTDANGSQDESSMPTDQAARPASTDKESKQSGTEQEQPSGHSQSGDEQKKLIQQTPGAGKLESELEPRPVNAIETHNKSADANGSEDKSSVPAYQEAAKISEPSEAEGSDPGQNRVHEKIQVDSQALNLNWEARANRLKNFAQKNSTHAIVSPVISSDLADAVTEENHQPSIKNGTLPSRSPDIQKLNNQVKKKPLKKWVWNLPANNEANGIQEAIRPIGVDEKRDLHSVVKSVTAGGLIHTSDPTAFSTASEETKNIPSNKADENSEKSYQPTNSTSKGIKTLDEHTGFLSKQKAGATKETERTATKDIHDDENKRISSSVFAKTVSASSRSGRSETKMVYSFDNEVEKIEVFVDDLLRAKIVKNSTGDSYVSDWTDCDLPTSRRVRATTVIQANGSKFKTVRVCDGIEEAISVYKDEILLCKIGSRVAE